MRPEAFTVVLTLLVACLCPLTQAAMFLRGDEDGVPTPSDSPFMLSLSAPLDVELSPATVHLDGRFEPGASVTFRVSYSGDPTPANGTGPVQGYLVDFCPEPSFDRKVFRTFLAVGPNAPAGQSLTTSVVASMWDPPVTTIYARAAAIPQTHQGETLSTPPSVRVPTVVTPEDGDTATTHEAAPEWLRPLLPWEHVLAVFISLLVCCGMCCAWRWHSHRKKFVYTVPDDQSISSEEGLHVTLSDSASSFPDVLDPLEPSVSDGNITTPLFGANFDDWAAGKQESFDPGWFQATWRSVGEQQATSFQLQPHRYIDASVLDELLERHGFHVVASGSPTAGLVKVYFLRLFADVSRAVREKGVVLSELELKETSRVLTCTHKMAQKDLDPTEAARLHRLFAEKFKEAIGSFVTSA